MISPSLEIIQNKIIEQVGHVIIQTIRVKILNNDVMGPDKEKNLFPWKIHVSEI
jgi:hypothetical protein